MTDLIFQDYTTEITFSDGVTFTLGVASPLAMEMNFAGQGARGDTGASGGLVGTLEAEVDLDADRFVNVATDGRIRYADAALGRSANGFIAAGIIAGATGEVHYLGPFNGFVGLTPGGNCWLASNGQHTQVPPTSGLSQVVAAADSATALHLTLEEPIEL